MVVRFVSHRVGCAFITPSFMFRFLALRSAKNNCSTAENNCSTAVGCCSTAVCYHRNMTACIATHFPFFPLLFFGIRERPGMRAHLAALGVLVRCTLALRRAKMGTVIRCTVSQQ